LFNKNKQSIIQCPGGKTGSYTIRNGVLEIAAGAFFGCTGLTRVTIPDSVNVLRGYAFGGCTNLTGIYFQGYAPSTDYGVFDGDSNVILYYLPWNLGWYPNNPMFAGRPTVMWPVQVQTSDPSFGVRTNQFGFNINWANAWVVVVEASAELLNPFWVPLQTNTLSGGSSYFSDPQWTNHPSRYYRLRLP